MHSRIPDAIALFSGGLDSILAVKLLGQQNLKIRCVHFYTPFFGAPAKVPHWRATYGLDIESVDAGAEFVAMLANFPEHGFGKRLNPCVDCKILMLSLARKIMAASGARFIITGEVLGQRPMSQRRDSLHLIQNKSGTRGLVLRPLSALHLSPTQPEETGIVDRSRLLGISGRGREAQLALATQLNLAEIPSPAGGCLLTEKENSARFLHLMQNLNPGQSPQALVADFSLARLGRQFIRGNYWLCVGRNKSDNTALEGAARPEDALLRMADFPGPLALGRNGETWPREILAEACSLTASYSPRARKADVANVAAIFPDARYTVTVRPGRSSLWLAPDWENTRESLALFKKSQLDDEESPET